MQHMRRPSRFDIAVLLVFGWALVATAHAQEPNNPDNTAVVLERWLLSAPERARFIAVVISQLRQHDVAEDGLDSRDIETVELTHASDERARRIRDLLIYDLDGDGRVTREEVVRVSRAKFTPRGNQAQSPALEKRIGLKVDAIMQADSNGDNTITTDEMRAYDPEKGKRRRTRDVDVLKALLALDPNKDGRLTSDELTRAAEETYRRYDADGDRVISADEMEQVRHAHAAERSKQHAKEICVLPSPTSEELVVVLGVHEGESLSTVTVAGMDATTTTGTLVIEPGAAPLYVILSSHNPTIWQLQGATQRISRVVAIANRSKDGPGVGVTGIDRKRISFLKAGSCQSDFYDVNSRQAQQARSTIELSLGRPVDTFAGVYGLETVNLPSAGLVRTPRRRGAAPDDATAEVQQEFLRFYPAGLTEFDPADVVAPGAVKPYDILPDQAGLIQLIRDKAILPLGNGRFQIVGPIARFPAGLYGAHSVKFVLGKGISMPGGSPGHSCVTSEEDGRLLAGSLSCQPRNTSAASSSGRKSPSKSLHPVLERTLLDARSHSQYITAVLAIFQKLDRDQDGLDAADIEAIEGPIQVRVRSDRLRALLSYDLDGDGRVTRKEVEGGLRTELGLPIEGTLDAASAAKMTPRTEKIMEADVDRDDIITYEEMLLPQKSDQANVRNTHIIRAKSLLDLDPNKDSRLTTDELKNLAEKTFRRYDVDGNNELSQREIVELLRTAQHGSRQ
jgi:Ca2+-binding EF-hand superfamily protein